MIRLLLFIFLFLCSVPAYAEWVEIATSTTTGATLYADPGTIRRKGDLVKMWTLHDFKTIRRSPSGELFLSSKTQLECDCAEERWRTLAFTWFSGNMGNGNVVSSYSDGDKWEPVAPESNGQTIWKFSCKKL